MTFNGRRPQNIKSVISQQPLIGPYSNFKLKLLWPNPILQILKMKTTSSGRRPQNIKCRIFSNNLLDHGQILNLSLDDHTIFYKSLKWRRPPLEEDFKILRLEYLSNHLLDHAQIQKFSLTKPYLQILWMKMISNGRRPQYSKSISANHLLDRTQL